MSRKAAGGALPSAGKHRKDGSPHHKEESTGSRPGSCGADVVRALPTGQDNKEPPGRRLGVSYGAGDENRTRALSLGSCGHLRPIGALTWASDCPVALPGSTAFPMIPRCSPLDLVRLWCGGELRASRLIRGARVDASRSVRCAAVGVLVGERLVHEPGTAVVTCAHIVEVPAGSSEAESAVGAATDRVCVVLVLAVVFPETDRADLVRSALGEGDETAARAAIRSVVDASSDMDEGHQCILVHPYRTGPLLFSGGLYGAVHLRSWVAADRAGLCSSTVARGTSARAVAQATLDAATTERTLLLAEVYRRGPGWRVRAVGQGYDHQLASLARGFGVDIVG